MSFTDHDYQPVVTKFPALTGKGSDSHVYFTVTDTSTNNTGRYRVTVSTRRNADDSLGSVYTVAVWADHGWADLLTCTGGDQIPDNPEGAATAAHYFLHHQKDTTSA